MVVVRNAGVGAMALLTLASVVAVVIVVVSHEDPPERQQASDYRGALSTSFSFALRRLASLSAKRAHPITVQIALREQLESFDRYGLPIHKQKPKTARSPFQAASLLPR